MTIIQTNRLILRQWRARDRGPFAALTADAEVMRYFPSVKTRAESDAQIDRFSADIEGKGFGFFAAERRDNQEFIGFIGINYSADGLVFAPCVDIGWRLAKHHWNNGFATEGALAALEFGFDTIKLDEIVSMTPVQNLASEGVMKKIGLQKQAENFLHPGLPLEHDLAEHVLYKLTRVEWAKNRAKQHS